MVAVSIEFTDGVNVWGSLEAVIAVRSGFIHVVIRATCLSVTLVHVNCVKIIIDRQSSMNA